MSDYSIAIRTLGKAGKKYQKLLDSIKNSSVSPIKVIVVLPEGYDPPKERLGYETFVYCAKSMIGQRIEALKYIDTEYTLFFDDDIEFQPDFIGKLLSPLEKGLFDCSTGPLFSFFPHSIAGKIAGTLTASVSFSLFRRDYYVKILRSGGWSYHTFDTTEDRYYPTESFAWTCFAIRTDVMSDLHMEVEQKWLERFEYANGDDRVMAYKLIKKGYRACVVANATYIHNDAKTAISENKIKEYQSRFCMYYMHSVFWHRFIHIPEKRVLFRAMNRVCFSYWKCSMIVYCMIKFILSGGKDKRLVAFIEGTREGKCFVRSNEYKKLDCSSD